MKVLVLGATGRTGKQVVLQLLLAGHEVSAIVRDKSKIMGADRLSVFEGNIDTEKLHQAMVGCDAIVSALNISRTTDFPWSKLRTPKTFMSDTMVDVIKVGEELGISRIVVCSAWGAAESKKEIPGWFKWFIDNSNIAAGYEDHERQESLLQKSAMNFTIVRPVGLTNAQKDKEVVVSQNNSPKPKLTISRKNVARFMTNLLNDHSYERAVVTISEK